MGMKRYELHRGARTATRTVFMVALLSLSTYNSAVAQQTKGPKFEATAEVRQATAGAPWLY
jgi:hypothetical protein